MQLLLGLVAGLLPSAGGQPGGATVCDDGCAGIGLNACVHCSAGHVQVMLMLKWVMSDKTWDWIVARAGQRFLAKTEPVRSNPPSGKVVNADKRSPFPGLAFKHHRLLICRPFEAEADKSRDVAWIV
jgi:hypothetical protein